MSSRIENSTRNAKYGIASQILYLILAFVLRIAITRNLGIVALSLNHVQPVRAAGAGEHEARGADHEPAEALLPRDILVHHDHWSGAYAMDPAPC